VGPRHTKYFMVVLHLVIQLTTKKVWVTVNNARKLRKDLRNTKEFIVSRSTTALNRKRRARNLFHLSILCLQELIVELGFQFRCRVVQANS
jgi:hypothetical protein